MGLRKGEGGFLRIQNKSSTEVEIRVGDRHNVDDLGWDQLVGAIAPGGQLPEEGEECFDGSGFYQYVEGDVKNRFQKDGFIHLEAHPVDGSPCSKLRLVVDRTSWQSKDDSEDAESSVKLVADVDEEGKTWKIELRIYDNYNASKWMEEYGEKHSLGEKKLCEVGMPGTHDSGTYKFDKECGASPDTGLTKLEDILDRGRLLGKVTDWILGNVFERLCQCQDKSIKEQLESGVRYIDLRVGYHEGTDKFMTCHGVYCVDVKEILEEVNDFLTENTKEIVIVEFKKLFGMKEEHHVTLCQLVIDTLGDKIADRKAYIPESTVQEYWDNNQRAIILYRDRHCIPDFQDHMWPLHRLDSPWPNAGDSTELHNKLKEKVEARDPTKFFVIQGILTPDVDVIKKEILDGQGLSIKKISRRCNGKVVDWVEEEWKPQNLNIVIVDFYEFSNIIPAIINYNRS